MKISISITDYRAAPQFDGLRAQLAASARIVDDSDIDTLWVADHLLQADPTATFDDPMLEAYTALGFLAARTERVRLGTMVTAATFRPPALTVKAVTTLDVLSGGRAWLGVGAGYQQAEADAMGLPLPPTAHRFEELEDLLRLALQMWSGDDSPFDGARHRLGRPINSPQAVQRPHPLILIGGTGEQKTLRLVARYGDACNLFDVPDGGATIRRKLSVLAQHCVDVGRPYADITKTVTTALGPGESSAEFLARTEYFAELGLDHVCVIRRGSAWNAETLAVLTHAAALAAG